LDVVVGPEGDEVLNDLIPVYDLLSTLGQLPEEGDRKTVASNPARETGRARETLPHHTDLNRVKRVRLREAIGLGLLFCHQVGFRRKDGVPAGVGAGA